MACEMRTARAKTVRKMVQVLKMMRMGKLVIVTMRRRRRKKRKKKKRVQTVCMMIMTQAVSVLRKKKTLEMGVVCVCVWVK